MFGGIHTLGQVANVHEGSCLGSSIESQMVAEEANHPKNVFF